MQVILFFRRTNPVQRYKFRLIVSAFGLKHIDNKRNFFDGSTAFAELNIWLMVVRVDNKAHNVGNF